MNKESQSAKHYRSCNLCEAICGLIIEYEGNKVLAIKGDPDDPLSKGHICPKAVTLQDLYNDPNRLRKPLKRTGSKWQEISWNEAFREAGRQIRKLQEAYGNDAIAFYQGNPTVHNYGSMLFNGNLKKVLRTRNHYSATSLDQLPHQYVAQLMFGHPLLIPVPDIDRTDFFLIIGANPQVSNGSMMTAPGMANRLKSIQKRDGKVVVIDPRRTETAKKADQHFFIRPETDVYLLLAMINEVFNQGFVNPGKAEKYIRNIDSLQKAVAAFTPEKVSRNTGIDAQDIITLTKEFAQAKTAVCYGRMGVSVQHHGTLNQWLINVLNIITGNFDTPGGHMFTRPAVNVRRGKKRTPEPRWYSRVSNKPEMLGELPTSVLAEEILEPGEGQIKGLVISAGNPVLSAPNGKKLVKALTSLDYMVAIDIYLNETTRHAHLILPPATGLETDHYDLAFTSLSVRNYAKYSPALFSPEPDSRYDWQIFKTLANEVKKPASLKARLMNWWLTPQRMLNIGLKTGPYGKKNGLSLKKLRQQPHGIDLGPLQPMLPEALFTADKTIDLAPERLLMAQNAIKLHFADENDPNKLLLISRRNLRSNNSWMFGIKRLQGGSNRCTLQINPQDARGMADGSPVKVSSATGSITTVLELTEDMMPGVASLPYGRAEASYNDLVDEKQMDSITGNAGFSGVPISIEPITGHQ